MTGLQEDKMYQMCEYYVPQATSIWEKYRSLEGSRAVQREFVMERVRLVNQIIDVIGDFYGSSSKLTFMRYPFQGEPALSRWIEARKETRTEANCIQMRDRRTRCV